MILSVWQNWDIGQTWEDKNENKGGDGDDLETGLLQRLLT